MQKEEGEERRVRKTDELRLVPSPIVLAEQSNRNRDRSNIEIVVI